MHIEEATGVVDLKLAGADAKSDEQVVLVDAAGQSLLNPDGSELTELKGEAHRHGLLHRAVSVFLFDPRGRLLLQKRAADKYHSGGLWTNTCCSHPHPGEAPIDAARRRLLEEMGIDCPITLLLEYLYETAVGAELVEHEYDHIFVGIWQGEPKPDIREVESWHWMTTLDLERSITGNPNAYTAWFTLLYDRVLQAFSASNLRGSSQAFQKQVRQNSTRHLPATPSHQTS